MIVFFVLPLIFFPFLTTIPGHFCIPCSFWRSGSVFQRFIGERFHWHETPTHLICICFHFDGLLLSVNLIIECSLFICNILRKKWVKKLILLPLDFNTFGVNFSYKVILSILMGMIKHSQGSHRNKFAISSQHLKKEVRDRVHFFCMQINIYKLALSFLKEVILKVRKIESW